MAYTYHTLTKREKNMVLYKDWNLEYNPKPIPSRKFDWDCRHNEFDEDPGCDDRNFQCASIDEAMEEIDDWDANH